MGQVVFPLLYEILATKTIRRLKKSLLMRSKMGTLEISISPFFGFKETLQEMKTKSSFLLHSSQSCLRSH